VTLAGLLAAVAAGCAVGAAWDALVLAETARVPATLRHSVARVLATGRGGREPTSPERARLAALGALALFAAGWLVAGPVAGLAVGAAGPAAATALVRARKRRWRAALEDGAPAVARALADALTGGHSIRGALAEAAHAGGGPRSADAAGAELARCASELALGERTETVLTALARRTGLPAYDTLVAAILLQRDAGGDLANLLRGVARSLEESARVAADARSATAQARFTAGVVTALPAGAAALAELAQPGYLMSLLGAPIPAVLAGTAAVLQVAALVLVRRLGRVTA
jgi:tight adherence protein B